MQRTNVPTLCFVGAVDGAVDVEIFDHMHKVFTQSLHIEVVKDAGHFVHQEMPAIFHSKTLEFIRS